ncbi:MAG TPA: hypothetical protein VLT33_10400, partial [Labilithrix sp.]|nr:hypothetical protein [Labilithrix sp.]
MHHARVTALSLLSLALVLAACQTAATDDRPAPGESDAASDGGAEAAPVTAAPPAIAKVAFLAGPSGPRILVAGTDPGKRLESVWVALLDANGAPAAIDPDGDGVTEPSVLEID